MTMIRLPPLRQDLTLSHGPKTPEGAPTWMLHDPAGNRFFQIGWPAFELLSRWSLDEPAEIVAAVNHETTLTVTLEDFENLLRTLRQQHLLVAIQADDTARLAAAADAGRLSHAMWLLKHYLMIRIPLWRPMGFLRRSAPYVAFAYRPAFWILVALSAATGLGLLSRRWDEFVHTFHSYADLRGLLGIGIAIVCAKVLHEFGHAFTACRYGCRVPTMGLAFLVMLPVLYTDTTEAWKVTRRGDRLRIGAAGMLCELALAAFATLLWNLLPDGSLRAGAFLLATTTWIGTLAINASPFMRFDGYFLLSDWLDMPNLHDRAFALGRWWLREWLFGFGEPQPEPCAPPRRRFLIAFAFVTWLYRLVVFFSIALIVYHAFFKVLGMALFGVELGWFILRPLTQELRACWQRRERLRWNLPSARTAALAMLLLAAIALPWYGGVNAPAVFGPQHAQGFYALEAGYLSDGTPTLHEGQSVHAGDVLAVLDSPDLQHKLAKAQAEEALLKWQLDQQSFDDRLKEQGVALYRHWDAARQTIAGLSAQIARLTIRAPFDGTIEALDEGLAAGTWLPRGARLFDVVGPVGIKGEAFVGETDAVRIHAGDQAVFVASLAGIEPLHCSVTELDRVNLASFDEPYVASTYGGPLPAQQQVSTHQLVPLHATYRVRIDGCSGAAAMPRQLVGVTRIGRTRESFAWRSLKKLVAIVQQESDL